MRIILRAILKIILFPITLILSILVLVLSFIIGIGSIFLNLISGIAILAFLGALWHGEKNRAIEAFVFAFLFSPYGLPLFASLFVEGIAHINQRIRSI